MHGKIITKSRQKIAKFVADSGTGIPIIPIELVKRHELEWEEVDPDEPGCESASGHDMDIIGQCTFWVKFDNMKNPKLIRALVAQEAGEEILLDLDLLIEWTILPADFPNPQDPEERETKARKVTVKESTTEKLVEIKEKKGSQRSKIRFNEQMEDDYDSGNQLEELKNTLLKEYSDIFKTELTREDK